MVAYGATSPTLSDKGLHPYFSRTSPPDSIQGGAQWTWMNFFDIPAVAYFYTQESYGQGLFQTVSDLASAASQAYRVTGVGIVYQQSSYDLDIGRTAMQSVRSSGTKFVIMSMSVMEGNAA
eukprot:2935998-Amphidinium_carterae.1